MRAGGRVARPDPLPHQHREPRRPHLRQPLVPRRRRGRQPQGAVGHLHGPEGGARPVRVRARGVPTDDPMAAAILPDRDAYYADLPRGTVVFTRRPHAEGRRSHLPLPLDAGPHARQLGRARPEERAVFTGDTIFSGCQTWLMTSNVDQWLEALGADPRAWTSTTCAGSRAGRRSWTTSRPSGRCS
jgi:hypothetical protein